MQPVYVASKVMIGQSNCRQWRGTDLFFNLLLKHVTLALEKQEGFVTCKGEYNIINQIILDTSLSIIIRRRCHECAQHSWHYFQGNVISSSMKWPSRMPSCLAVSWMNQSRVVTFNVRRPSSHSHKPVWLCSRSRGQVLKAKVNSVAARATADAGGLEACKSRCKWSEATTRHWLT